MTNQTTHSWNVSLGCQDSSGEFQTNHKVAGRFGLTISVTTDAFGERLRVFPWEQRTMYFSTTSHADSTTAAPGKNTIILDAS